MNILITAIHYPIASGRYAAAALRRLGHDVRTAGPCTGRRIWDMDVDEVHVWLTEFPEEDWNPELVIHMDGNLPMERTCDAPHIVYGVDNHVRKYDQMEWDHLFLAHGHGFRIGEDNVTWLPCAYDPVWFTPGPAWSQRTMDAALIGVQYGPRAELLYALRERIPAIRMDYRTGPLFAEYAHAYQNAKISLVRSVLGDVAMRVWETAAMGCLVVMDQCPDGDDLGLVDGKNCLIYRTLDEALDKVQWALSDPKQAEAIARKGQEWALPGTWDARMQVIVEWAEAQTAPKREKATAK